VLGGSVAVLAVELLKWVFPRFADAISLSQARRLAAFVPFAFALTGGAAVLAGLARFAVLPLALGGGIALQLAFPGDYGTLSSGGPSWATYVAAFGGVAAIALGVVLRRRVESDSWIAGLAVVLFVLPVAVHGAAHWTRTDARDPNALTPGLIAALRERVPKRAVVFSDLETSYRISAYAPVYVAAAPPAHVADTEANRPYRRRLDVIRFFRTRDVSILRRYEARWLVVDKRRFHVRPRWRLVYGDARYALYHRRT
jgi:hypothetical protein